MFEKVRAYLEIRWKAERTVFCIFTVIIFRFKMYQKNYEKKVLICQEKKWFLIENTLSHFI